MVVMSSATVVAAPDDVPYEPPPFTRFPDEPDDPPPVHHDKPAAPPPVHHDKPAAPPPVHHDKPAAPRPVHHDKPAAPQPVHHDKPAAPPPVHHDKPAAPPPVHHDKPAAPPPVHHDKPAAPQPVHHDDTTLEFLVGFNAPLELAAGVELVLPWRIRLGTSVGVLPRSVARAGNTQLVEHGAYARSYGDLVDASMERVLLWHAHVAVKPWKRHGFLATVGYGVAWIHGTATLSQVADAVGVMIPDDVPLGDVRCDVRSRLPLLDAELGWEWRWHRHWSLRVNLGAAVILGARTHVTLQPAIDDDRLRDLMSRAQAKIDHVYTTYGKTPLLSVLLGYQL